MVKALCLHETLTFESIERNFERFADIEDEEIRVLKSQMALLTR